jgi:PAS domain S-box-containing protein
MKSKPGSFQSPSSEKAAGRKPLDLQRIFEAAPGCFLVLAPDIPRFTILAVTDAYLEATKTRRSEILGKGVFEVFPDNPDDPADKAVGYARASFERVLEQGRPDVMGIRKHDIRRPESAGGGYEERFWDPVNIPVLGADGKVAFIIHGVEDVTESVRLEQEGAEQQAVNMALRDSRAAALNLVQDAVAARRQAERISVELRQEVAERRRAEEALRKSEEKYRRIVETAQEGILVADPEGAVAYANERIARILGYSVNELVGKPGLELAADRDAATAREKIRQRQEKIQGQYEIWLRRKDGGEVCLLASGTPILDADGRHAGNLAMYVDITQRKRDEAALRESEERLRRAQEIAHLGSWDLDLAENKLTWSDEVYRIFGLAPQEFSATYEAFLDAIHPDDRAAVDAAYSGSVREGRDGYEIEHRIVRRDTGEIRVVHEKCEHRRDASGRIIRSVGMVHDITERRKTEALRLALAEQERLRLGAAVEQASDAVVMVDLDGTIRYVNAAFVSISRSPRDEVLGRSYFDLLAGDPALAAVRDSVAHGHNWHGLLTRPVPDGRPVELEVTISPATDPTGSVIGGLVTEKDVTQENALQRQVRQAQKMEALGTLAGGISHDFNNILGAIVINTELALLDLDPSNPARRPLPLVLQAANRGKDLIKQIITFSRQREWERQPLEIAPVIKEGLKFLGSTLPKDVTLHEAVAADCGAILGDPSQIHQVLVNLAQNAALAMSDRGGDMEVKLEPLEVDTDMVIRHPDLRPGPYVRLTVADSGCGIRPEVLERIFEPFFTTRETGGGSGLGLAVVHSIVKSYKGAINVYSEPGKGSVFHVYLPRLEKETPAGGTARPLQPVRGRERILFVDDEAVQRTSLTEGLTRLGYKVTARAEGRSALTAFKKDPKVFDLVITDQTMPRMSGVELAAALVKIRPDIPIVLCTGFSEKVNGGTVGRNGIREFIMKPFTLQEITTLIRKALNKE